MNNEQYFLILRYLETTTNKCDQISFEKMEKKIAPSLWPLWHITTLTWAELKNHFWVLTLEWGRVQLVLKHITHNDNDGYIYGGNMTVSHSHPYSLWHIPTWWEYGGWEYAGKPKQPADKYRGRGRAAPGSLKFESVYSQQRRSRHHVLNLSNQARRLWDN